MDLNVEFTTGNVCFAIAMAWLVFATIGGIFQCVKSFINRLNKRPYIITYCDEDKSMYFVYDHNLKKYVVDETFDCSKAGPEVFQILY